MTEWNIIQWATILSPIIAVFIAVVTSWLNSRDVKKQINAIKQLSLLQLSATNDMLELELMKYNLGEVKDRDQLQSLSEQMAIMLQAPSINIEEMAKLEKQIYDLKKNVHYQRTLMHQIVFRQFDLLKFSQTLKQN